MASFTHTDFWPGTRWWDRRLINMVEDKSFNVFLTSCDSYTPACCYYSPSVPAVHRKKKLGMLLYFD